MERIRTCTACADPVARLFAHAVHVSEAHLAADATLNAPERTQSAAVTFFCLDPLHPGVHHWCPGLNLCARTEGKIFKKDLALSCKLDQGLIKIEVAHEHGTLSQNTAGGGGLAAATVAIFIITIAEIGRVISTNSGAAAVALGVAICVVEGLY